MNTRLWTWSLGLARSLDAAFSGPKVLVLRWWRNDWVELIGMSLYGRFSKFEYEVIHTIQRHDTDTPTPQH